MGNLKSSWMIDFSDSNRRKNMQIHAIFSYKKRCFVLVSSCFLPDWQPLLIFVWFTSKSHEHMHKKFEINRTKIKGSCQLCRKVVSHNSKSNLHQILKINWLKTAKKWQKKLDPLLVMCSWWIRNLCRFVLADV